MPGPYNSLPFSGVKVLLVTIYFPPAGGGGVQRPLKLAQYLPALGIETHVLAPDDPKWVHRDEELRVPTQAWVHRARYVGPRGAEAGRGAARAGRLRSRARPGAGDRAPPARARRERHLEPDRDPGCDPHRAPRGHRRRDHDVAAELDPPRRRGGPEGDRCALGRRPARLRSSRNQHRRADTTATRAGRPRTTQRRAARRASSGRDLVRLGGDRRRGARARAARASSARSPNGCDFDDFDGLEYRPATAVPDHAHRQLLRQARPAAVPAGARTTPGSTRSPASSATSARPTASGPSSSGSATGSS